MVRIGYNKQYEKGVKWERQIVNDAREEGHIAFRSAGSHSPIDVCIVDQNHKIIYLIQAKNTKQNMSKLKEEFDKIEYTYKVIWKVMEKTG